MALVPWQATVQDEFGNSIPEPVVTVRNASDDTLATIYNISGSSIANPVTGDLEGFVQFQVSPGRYKIEGAKGGSLTNVWEFEAQTADNLNRSFNSRSDMVAEFAALSAAEKSAIPDGAVWSWPGASVVKSTGATAISDMQDFIPNGDVTPLHFGATGDGTTDDLAAFQAAVAYSLDVYVPPAASSYYLSAPLTLRSNQNLYGSRFINTKLRFVGTGGIISPVGGQHVYIADLQLNGDGSAATIGISVIGNQRQTLIERVRCYNFGRSNAGGGIVIQDSTFGGIPTEDMWGVRVSDCNVEYCGRGIALLNVRSAVIDLNVNRLCYGSTFYAEDCEAITVIGGAHENSNNTIPGTVASSWSAHLKNCRGITLNGFDCENMVDGLVLLDNSHACQIDLHGGTAEAGATMLSLINGSSENTITGSTGDLWDAGHTGISIALGCDNNRIGPLILANPGTINASATKVSDLGSGNDLQITYGDGSGVLRQTQPDETGTFTPQLLFGGGNTGMTGTFSGTYSKSGNIVSITVSIALSAKGTSTGSATIDLSDLGYTPSGSHSAYPHSYFNFSSLPGPFVLGLGGLDTAINIRVHTASASLSATDTVFTDTSSLYLSMTFKTS